MAQPNYPKLAGTSNPTFQFGIAAVAALLKWTASKFTLRNKADTNYVGLALSTVDVYDSAGTNKTTLGFPTGAGADRAINFPTGAPTAGYGLVTDASGNLSYAAAGNTAVCQQTDTTTLAFGSTSPLAMFTLPANAIVTDVQVVVDTAFTGGTGATVSIGVTGTLSKYSGTGDCDLGTAGVYDVGPPGLPTIGATTENVIATYVSGSATAGSARLLVTFVVPS